MTDGTSRPMVFGDIDDLLRKVNGESEPAYMWQSDRQGKEVRTEEPPAVQEEQVRDPDEKPKEGTTPIVHKENEPKARRKDQPHKEKSHSSVSNPVKEKEHKHTEPSKVNKPLVNKSQSSFPKNDILSQIEAFSCDAETGHRHWIFLPTDVVTTLEAVYGSHRISAIFTALARSFIDANKEELRRLVTHRSGLFEQDSQRSKRLSI